MTFLLATEASDAGFTAVEATGTAAVAWLIPLLPLVGFVVLVFNTRRIREPLAGYVATATAALSFMVSLLVFVQLLGQDAGQRTIITDLFTWFDIGGFHVDVALLLDPLSSVMLLVITGVGSLIHLYSIGYMRGDERFTCYFAYLNLFLFSMLVLVLGSDLLVLFVGWELVGLCSYLLIGFWFERSEYASAAKKAFIVNRVGDVSFMIGMFLIFNTFGTLAFAGVLPEAGAIAGTATATAIGLLLLGGATGKSAQIPLYVWLPDAMAGPTPVSALIHAATMVTAGVYMIARMSALYLGSTTALDVIAWIGVATALLAALIAVRQDDIKKILAYSTVSQLGFMFIGVGVGAFAIGIFHLVTHAFFKALLFLAAGSVMHALTNEQNVWKMGGLRKHMPITFATSAIAWAAISGIPPFAGFWSKDQILTEAYETGHEAIWALGLAAAILTAFYMTRWLILVFFGQERFGRDLHPHESPPTMTVPLIVLAVLSAVGGVALNPTLQGPLARWLETAVGAFHADEGLDLLFGLSEPILIALSVLAAAIGIGTAYLLYFRDARERLTGPVARLLEQRFHVDQFYELIFVKGGGLLSRGVAVVDRRVIDGAVNGVAGATRWSAGVTRRVQTGLVRAYVGVLALGTVTILVVFLVRVG